MATRRGRGEGSITRRNDGRWMARVDLGWEDGKRRRKTLYGRTRRAVQDKLRETLQRSEHGLPPVPERETVGGYLQRWMDFKKGQLRPRTYVSYEHVVHAHLEPGLGRVRLARLAPQDVATWLSRHQANGASARTARYARAVLRAALNQALRWELVARNAAALTDPPRHAAREIQPLTPSQATTLLAALAGHRLEALVSVGLGLGLRLGEALGLRWDAVDLEAGVLSVRQTLERAGGDPVARRRLTAQRRQLLDELDATRDRVVRDRLTTRLARVRQQLKAAQTTIRFAEPKTKRSRRTITIPEIVTDALRAHRKRQVEERLAAGPRWREAGLVFTSSVGTPLDARNLTRTFKAILRQVGLPAIRYHDLRHTAATLLLAQGVDPRTIMETLGHCQISLTLNTYTHVVPALQREAAVKMHEILTR